LKSCSCMRSCVISSKRAQELDNAGEDLVDALFGGAGVLPRSEIVFGLVAAAGIIVFVVAKRNELILTLVSPDVARTSGINVRRLDFFYLQMFALTIALGLRYLGVLLMGALIIIPAATAKRPCQEFERDVDDRGRRCGDGHRARDLSGVVAPS
ncbi:MAG TPA: metal ABC transporter permease, partial [Vicinamibacterales bacterium]